MTDRSRSSLFENFQKYAYLLARRCYSCLNCAERRRVYPELSHHDHNKIIRLQSNKLIRVIHYKKSENKRCSLFETPMEVSDQPDGEPRTFSFSNSDYAFTSWSKPLRLCDECRRSFKNLWQETAFNPVITKQCSVDVQEDPFPVPNLSPSQESIKQLVITSSLERYVDSLVTDIISDSLYIVYGVRNVSSTDTLNRPLDSVVNCHKQSNTSSKLNNLEHCDDIKSDVIENKHCLQYFLGILDSESSSECDHNLQNHGFSVSKVNSISSECNKDVKEHRRSSEEKYAYYNNSFSDAEEETNVDQEKIGDKVPANRSLSICSHLKNRSTRPVLVFLHGVGCCAEIWQHQLRYFAERAFEVVAPDMLGHGLSSAPDQPSAYAFHSLLEDTGHLLDTFVHGDNKCIIIAHAFGCSVAVALARARVAQVAQLVLVSGGGPTPLAPRGPDSLPPRPAPWRRLLPLRPLLCCGFSRELVYAAPRGTHIATAQLAAAAEAWAGAGVTGAGAAAGVPAYVLSHAARGQLWTEGDAAFHRRVTQPTLLVHGLRDPLVSLPQECDMERTIPRATLELIPNAGHFAMLETPAKLCHMIECFINWWNL